MLPDHLGTVAAEAADRFGDREALVFEGRSFSFRELGSLVEHAASGLARIGVRQGDIVTLYASNCWEWIVSYYAIARAGAIINPVNTMLTSTELQYVMQDCGTRVIIASPDKLEQLAPLIGTVDAVIAFGGDLPDGVLDFGTLLDHGNAPLAMPSVPADSLSTICYTSGTTGHPKGAMQSHRAVLLNGAMTAQMQLRGATDVMVSALPCPHVYANVVIQAMMLKGAKLVLHRRFDAGAVLRDLQAHRATVLDGVPTMYMYMLEEPSLAEIDLSSLTRVYVGGQTMPAATMAEVERRLGVPMIELWGMTEIAGLGTTHPLWGENLHGSVGCALPYCQLRIVDPAAPEIVLDEGEVGELQIKGPMTMMGYYGDQAKTAETLLAGGWLRTGDLARMDASGRIFVVDRLKDMILTGGFNIYPAEIERVLAEHPAISMAAVGRQPDPVKGEVAKAYIVLRPGPQVEATEIQMFCRERLAAYKCPRLIQFVDELPKTSSGKVMRRELHKLDLKPAPVSLS
jgi:long-chain acyl-CoA synthetase